MLEYDRGNNNNCESENSTLQPDHEYGTAQAVDTNKCIIGNWNLQLNNLSLPSTEECTWPSLFIQATKIL